MGTGGAAGGADPADDAAAGQALAQLHVHLRHVTEHADEALAVVDEHRIAVEEVVADEDDLASGWCLDGSAGSDREVEAGVGVALLAVEEAAQPEEAGERALDRLVKQQVARLSRAEGLVGAGLFGKLPVDAGHDFGQRIDLAAVLELDVLLTVVLGADRETQGAAIAGGHLMGAGRALERDADDGDPRLPVFLYHQHRLVLIAHCGRLGPASQWYHGHAPRHRVVEQAADKPRFGVKRRAAEQQEKKEEAAHDGSIGSGGKQEGGDDATFWRCCPSTVADKLVGCGPERRNGHAIAAR